MSEELRIISNYHARPLFSSFELTDEEKKEFNYINFDTNDDLENSQAWDDRFVRYKGQVIDVYDVESGCYNSINPFGDFWHAWVSDSFFSGLLVHFCNEEDAERGLVDYMDYNGYVVMGWYMS